MLFDEATDLVGMKTEEMIQDVIQENFSNSTLLLIVHRISSAINSDKILVMDKGKVLEFDT